MMLGADRRNSDLRKPTGFTLVELLVVIAIVGILVALLLPAIQAAREASRRGQCANSLKQLIVGLHNYHDTKGILPLSRSSVGGITWMAQILPFLEEQSAFALYQPNTTYSDPKNQSFRDAVIAVFACPSRRPPGKTQPNA